MTHHAKQEQAAREQEALRSAEEARLARLLVVVVTACTIWAVSTVVGVVVITRIAL